MIVKTKPIAKELMLLLNRNSDVGLDILGGDTAVQYTNHYVYTNDVVGNAIVFPDEDGDTILRLDYDKYHTMITVLHWMDTTLTRMISHYIKEGYKDFVIKLVKYPHNCTEMQIWTYEGGSNLNLGHYDVIQDKILDLKRSVKTYF